MDTVNAPPNPATDALRDPLSSDAPEVVLSGDWKNLAAPAAMAVVVAALLAPGKGLLAADESLPTIAKRFADIDLAATEDHRRSYRELLFTAPGLETCISGVILFDETMHQRTRSGLLFPHLLAERGIIPGIKVDLGTVDLALHPGERITQGIDGLRARLVEYRRLGARFTKWRAVLAIADHRPSQGSRAANAALLALFAALSQEAGLVPIIEPEVLMQGDHDLDRCEAVMTDVLGQVFAAIAEHGVVREHLVLKTGMVLSGSSCPEQATDDQIAAATRRCLLRAVPAAVPGIVFLSGGQSSDHATQRLAAICQPGSVPWPMSFSFGRALQQGALSRWHGSPDHVAAAQDELQRCARRLGAAVTPRTGDPAGTRC